MKWLALAAALVAMPAAGALARGRPKLLRLGIGLLAFLPFIGERFTMNLYALPAYRGDSLGFEVALVDLVALALFVAAPKREAPAAWRVPRALYLLAVLASIPGADRPLYALFSTWKLLRMYFVFAVATRYVRRPELTPAALTGLALGVVYVTATALHDRYGLGILRASGAMPHSNTLGMAVNLVYPTSLALLLAGRGGWLAPACIGGAGLCVILGQSRGSLALFALAGALVFAGTARRGLSARKIGIALGVVFAGLVVLGQSLDSLIARFENAPKSSAEARHRFNDAAAMMLADHPLTGIGINHYSHAVSEMGYGDRAGVLAVDRHGVAHHVYWLTLAELGLLGLLAYLGTLLPPLVRALRGAFRARGDPRADVLLGLSAGLTVTYLQGLMEWVARQTEVSYMFWLSLALVDALTRQLRRR
ncbi:MAG TPA: O-antigen ligase family protein [Polyangiaceae bacterium LLY-WYZ-15_(1-7)]|nr:hypothetical protein [Sandaracinus sp.]MBJ70373.1 hypothetical protein [Sandaracinus sp.]HJL03815.1 O-antigen ligase family protein [Polyangiaceae bacterium LLY-WYZ-15_(1-7)]HJL07551.1 O-antigen ligase family protein [Polyangiaceae bacterium LLY-WYZ-15_(1-7)]HJL38762.1 O-antigen ligase family protein [Polyangiaceae bacterium LLY-WYZ-15_(1-7)]